MLNYGEHHHGCINVGIICKYYGTYLLTYASDGAMRADDDHYNATCSVKEAEGNNDQKT